MANGGAEAEGGGGHTSCRKNYSRTKRDVWQQKALAFVSFQNKRNVAAQT